MKKVSFVVSIVIVLGFVICLSSCQTFDGYYYNLDDARNEIKFYMDADFLFTNQQDGVLIDFVVKKNILHIVEIKVDGVEPGQKFQVKHSSSFPIEEAIYSFEQSNEYHWKTSSELSLCKWEWCIVSKEFNSNNDNFSSFEFVYKDVSYCLCYKGTQGDGSPVSVEKP